MNEKLDIRNRRFKEMDETRKWVKREISILQNLLGKMRLFNDGGQLENYCLGYLKEKISNKPLRAYFVRKMYEYLNQYSEFTVQFKNHQNTEILFTRKLPFVFEVVITIQYLDNQILDEKYDLNRRNHSKIVQNLIAGSVLRELLFVYVDRELGSLFPDRASLELLKANLHRLLLWVDVGQYFDKEYNHYDRWKEKIPVAIDTPFFFDGVLQEAIHATSTQVKNDVPEKADFVEVYFRRIYLTNVFFFRCMTETLMSLGNYQGVHHRPLLLFSIQYGFMLQIINDYADFAYADSKQERKQLKTAGKKPSDIFADLYNFNVTLPLIYHLKKVQKGKIVDFLEDKRQWKSILNKYPKQIRQEIWESDAINAAVLISIDLSESAKSHLDKKNDHYAFFAHMCDIAIETKFYQVFK